MYKKSVQGWLKHLDFMILDVVCLWISFTLAFGMRHGLKSVYLIATRDLSNLWLQFFYLKIKGLCDFLRKRF